MDKKIIAAGVVAIAVFGGAGWYWGYYTKTPAYSLGIIKDSIQKHDVNKFKQHVDLDSFLSRGYDDLVEASIEDNKNSSDYSELGANFAKGLFVAFKPTITGEIKEQILRAVEEGKWDSDDKKDEKPKEGQGPKIDTNAIAENTGMKSAQFKGIASTKKDGKVAVVGLKIYEPSLNDDFVLDLKMRELDDGTWQLVEASNLKEYFTTLRKATQVSLKKYIDERAAAIKPYNDELHAKYPANKVITSDMYDDILATYSKIDEAAEKIQVPEAAKRYAKLANDSNAIQTQLTKEYKTYAAGDHSQETINKINELRRKHSKLQSEINGIRNSVKDIDTNQ